RIHERLALHSRRAGALVRADAVNDTDVQRTSQRRLDRVQNFLKHTELVILIRPLKLVSDANGLLELERLESLNRRGKVRARLILASPTYSASPESKITVSPFPNFIRL